MHETSANKQNIENDHADLRRWRLAEAIYIFCPFDHTARRRPKIRRPAQYIPALHTIANLYTTLHHRNA